MPRTVSRTRKRGQTVSLAEDAEATAPPSVDEARAKLEAINAAKNSLFQTPDRGFATAGDLKHGFQKIVHSVYDEGLDVAAEYEEIKEALVIKDALTPGVLAVNANTAEDMARRAYRLYILAKHEYESFCRQTDAIIGALRDAASSHCERQKAAGIRTKQITDADITGACAQLYPDEWADVNDKRDKAKGMMQYLENLSQLARGRCYTVSNMIGPSRKL